MDRDAIRNALLYEPDTNYIVDADNNYIYWLGRRGELLRDEFGQKYERRYFWREMWKKVANKWTRKK